MSYADGRAPGERGEETATRKVMMKKLTLDLEALDVDSFEPADSRQMAVAGAEEGMTVPPYCFTFTCGDSRIRPCLFG